MLGFLDDFAKVIKLFFIVTLAVMFMVFSFYPPDLWLGDFFLDLLPPFMKGKSFWLLFAENTLFLVSTLFVTAFVVFVQIMRKKF
jgi:hypothetical protein